MKDQKVAQLREQASFLGYEFLSWLFLLLDSEHAKEEVAVIVRGVGFKTPCAVTLGNRLVSCLLHHKEQKTSIATPILEESHEVFASLKNGHVIETLALLVIIDDTKINFTLNAHDFAISQLKITAPFVEENNEDTDLSEEEETREEIFLRMAAIADVEAIIDKLYARFLTLRLDGRAYPSVQKDMREQVDGRLGHYLGKGKSERVLLHDAVST